MQIFLELLVLLLITRLFSEGAERIGQPASIGELMAGVGVAAAASFLSPSIPFLVQLTNSEALKVVAHLGIFFLVLLAGIESKIQELQEHTRSAIVIALGGALLPLASGFGLGWAFLPESEFKFVQAFLIGVAMSITSIPATIKVLTEFNLLHSRLGQTIVGAAIVDDVLGLFFLAILTSLIQSGQVPDLVFFLLLLGKILLFFGITTGLGVHVYPRVSRGLKALKSAALEFSVLISVALAYSLLAEILDMHWILGVFMAGLYLEPGRIGWKAYQEMKLLVSGITNGFLGPLFFVWIGLHVEFQAVTSNPLFIVLLLFVAFSGKLIGSGLPAYWLTLNRKEALAIGVGMSNRGAMELVILSIALEAGLFAYGVHGDGVVTHLFSALVLMGVVTTFISLILLRRILPRPPN